jgi:Holin of 3TMs, for gene-transfer release
MGMIGSILGAGTAAREIGAAVGGVAEVFAGNRAAREAAEAAGFAATVGQYGAEFASAGNGRFDRFVNGLNRLPRPLLALGTLALFVYAMAEPVGFGERMQGLNLVPEPLWWLLGAIVSFYFGARELHHQRARSALVKAAGTAAGASPGASDAKAAAPGPSGTPMPLAEPVVAAAKAGDPDFNAAVEEWRRLRA